MDGEAFRQATGVSRETMDRLVAYAALLDRWQRRVNLIAPGTVAALWHRHFLDSAQLHPLMPCGATCLVDIGSGAGFPGLVLAILGVPDVHLIEADQRKAAFLREAARVSDVQVTIHACRSDSVPVIAADVVTARAVAPLSRLIPLVVRFVTTKTCILLPKGQDVDVELTMATKSGIINVDTPVERLASRTDPNATILRFGGHYLVGPGADDDR